MWQIIKNIKQSECNHILCARYGSQVSDTAAHYEILPHILRGAAQDRHTLHRIYNLCARIIVRYARVEANVAKSLQHTRQSECHHLLRIPYRSQVCDTVAHSEMSASRPTHLT